MLFLYRRTNPKTNEPKTFRPDFRRTVRISGPSDRRRRSGTNDPRLVEKILIDNPFGNASQKTPICIIKDFIR